MLRRRIGILKLLGALSTGILLAFSFPPVEWHGAAWCALIPLLVIARYSSPSAAFKWGLLSGAIAWLLSLAWLLRLVQTAVVPVGNATLAAVLGCLAWLALAAYCMLYIAVFASIAAGWFAAWGTSDWRKNIGFTVAIPMVWVGLEYLRSTLFTGFPWNALGVSQYANPSVCQVATWGGVYAVSALIVLVNAGVTMTILMFRGVRVAKRYRAHPELMITLLLLALTLVHGGRFILGYQPPRQSLRVIGIQPNVEQERKWPENLDDQVAAYWSWQDDSYARLGMLTRAATEVQPDLMIWPETAVPSFALADTNCRSFIEDLVTNGTPILAGAMEEVVSATGTNFYNSSLLFEPSGNQPAVYRKQHLVLFGEYVPFIDSIPPLAGALPHGWSCSAGVTTTVFRLESKPNIAFSVLICFEDTFATLARRAVRRGARLLINQTNDAWFDTSSGPKQHMANCVLRCIENRVPAIRVSNTGISCVIDPVGRILRNWDLCTFVAVSNNESTIMKDPMDGQLKQGYLDASIDVPAEGMALTFYTVYGDVFAMACLVFSATVVVLLVRHPLTGVVLAKRR